MADGTYHILTSTKIYTKNLFKAARELHEGKTHLLTIGAERATARRFKWYTRDAAMRSVSQQKCKVTMSMSLIERELSLQITIVGMGSLDNSESESDESESESVGEGESESVGESQSHVKRRGASKRRSEQGTK